MFEKAQITQNLDLAFRLVEEIIEDPSILDEIPDGAQMILLPDDTPEVAEANLLGGVRMIRQGHNVTFRRIPSNHAPAPGHRRGLKNGSLMRDSESVS